MDGFLLFTTSLYGTFLLAFFAHVQLMQIANNAKTSNFIIVIEKMRLLRVNKTSYSEGKSLLISLNVSTLILSSSMN